MSEHPITSESTLETALRDGLHAVGREGAADHLVGLADGALHQARRQRRARVGLTAAVLGVVVTAALGTAAIATRPGQLTAARPDATYLAEPLSLVPVLSVSPGACPSSAPGDYQTLQLMCYRLDSAKGLTVTALSGLRVAPMPGSGVWGLDLTLEPQDARTFAALTGALAVKESPANQIAVVVDHRITSAPEVDTRITDGRLVVMTEPALTRQSATALAQQLTGQ